MKPIVCVFAHPDDESLGPGGTIAKFATDREVYIICVTNGNGEGNAALGEQRKKELQNSAKILGVKEVIFLGYDDGSLNHNLYHELAEKIEQKIKELQPETLITFNINGVSGHLDHVAMALVTTFVFEKLDFIKDLWYYSVSQEMREAFGDYFIYQPGGLLQNEADQIIDISDVWPLKKQAMQQHKSHQKDVEFLTSLFEKFPKQEYFLKKTRD
jgi:LmbE family N-acetylglucosaminyl deacetylase